MKIKTKIEALIRKVISILLLSMFASICHANAEGGVSDKKRFAASYKEYEHQIASAHWLAATEPARQAYQIGLRIYESHSETIVLLANNLGYVLAKQGKNEEAKKYFKISLLGAEKVYGKEGIELVQILMDLASATIRPFKRGTEVSYFKDALRITEKHYGDDSRVYGELNLKIGNMILHKAKTNGGKVYTDRGMKILESTEGQGSKLYGLAAFQKGKYELASKNHRKAKAYFTRALDSFEKSTEGDNSFSLTTHAFLVRVNEELGQRDDATKHCLAIAEMTPESDDQERLPIYRAPPDYPLQARRRRQDGWVEMSFDVDEAGFVVNPKVIANSGYSGFQEAAIEAVKRYRYAPEFRDGAAVVSNDVKIRIVFEIAD